MSKWEKHILETPDLSSGRGNACLLTGQSLNSRKKWQSVRPGPHHGCCYLASILARAVENYLKPP